MNSSTFFFEKLDDKTERLSNSIKTYYSSQENKLDFLSKLLKSYSYTSVLERGFSLALDKKGNIISNGKEAEEKESFFVRFNDKEVSVSPIKNDKVLTKQKNKTKEIKISQGNLFGD